MSLENEFPATTAAAREKVQQALAAARTRTNETLARGEEMFRERPRTALLSAFALGLAAGVVVASALSRPPAPARSSLAESLDGSRDRLADLFGTVAAQLRDPLAKTMHSVGDRASGLGDSLSDVLDRVYPRKLRWW